MHSTFLVVLPLLYVLLMHISLLQLLAFNPEADVTVKCIERERQALLALKRGFQLDDKDMLSSWGDGEKQKECCNWEGIQCSNVTGHVLMLDLHADPDYYVTVRHAGSISPSLGELHHLNYLDLSYIYFNLTRSIPGFIGSLTLLRHLNLSYCSFQGKIPHGLGNLLFLEHLDLGHNILDGEIPSQLTNLLSLEYLDLTENDFTGTIPHHFRNLSNLQYLDLSSDEYSKMSLSSDLRWASHLSSLRHLSLPKVNLSSANNWLRLVSGLSHLQYLDLSGCNLLDSIPSSLSSAANFSTSLSFVDLSDNNLLNLSLILPWLMNSTSTLAILKLNHNSLKGTIPLSVFQICSLRELDLSENRLTGQFHEFIQAFSRCADKPLETLNMGWNEITGMVPDLSQLSSLRLLRLHSNGLNGTLHEGIGQLSNLTVLRLGNNSLQGLISEAHFSRLSLLLYLNLSHNALFFNISSEWVPPFNLNAINLASCTLGPDFPRWLQTQNHIFWLDISQANISSTVPNWFWELLPTMVKLNLSHNHIRGKIENLPLVLQDTTQIDLSSNLLEGPIPAFLSIADQVFLSNNTFSTADLLLCANRSTNIAFLDLSNNHLRGELPDCWMNVSLGFLDLSNNYFNGNLPRSMGSLGNIQSLHLGGNNFSGEIPMSFSNFTELQLFDAAQNNLSGPLPSWVGDNLPHLFVLSLHSNKFHGSMPLSICHLDKLHLLDLSMNNLSGEIPKCISNLSSMATQANSNVDIFYAYDGYYDDFDGDGGNFGVNADSASLIWKGKLSKYGSTLGLLRSIHLSSNRLTGEIPSEIMSLVALVSLNISRNMLSGDIPPTIGQLKSVDFLDLSRNHLSGRIPSELSQLDRLGVLDLSYNDLSGEIPLGTQLQTRDASAYIGNPKLCGAPLNNTCPIHGHQIDGDDAYAEQFFAKGFYIAMAIGFIMGFWGVCCSLILKKSWGYAYFKFLSDVYDKLYVLTAIKMAKLKGIRP